jgi:DnaD/phage-associated family protein
MGLVKQFVPAGRPQYTVEELTVYKQQSEEIERLFMYAEQALGKMLTYHDMNVLFGFYDWLRLPVDVIGYLLSYCADNGRRDLRYIEKAAIDWADRNIDDMEKALAYAGTFDRDYRGILKTMGQDTGYPSPTQQKYMEKWLGEYKMPAALVLLACDRAAAQIGKPTFAYVNKIIEGWNKKGINTIEGAEEEAKEFILKKEAAHKKTEAAKGESNGRPPKNNRFINFKQRERDYEQLEKMEREYVLKSLQG